MHLVIPPVGVRRFWRCKGIRRGLKLRSSRYRKVQVIFPPNPIFPLTSRAWSWS